MIENFKTKEEFKKFCDTSMFCICGKLMTGFPDSAFEQVRKSELETIFLGDGTAICRHDKYIWERHFVGEDGKMYYHSDLGTIRQCGDWTITHKNRQKQGQ